MNIKTIILLYSALILTPGFLFPSEVPLRHYSPETILIQSQVNEIVQDSRGFLWIGTMGGINIFTGASVTALTSRNGLGSEWIRCLTEATPDTMWIGTVSGLGYCPFTRSDSVTFLPKTTSREIRGVAKFQNRLYVATMFGGLYTLNGDSLLRVDAAAMPEGTIILDLIVWRDALWLATNKGLSKWDGKSLSQCGPDEFILNLAGSDKGLWCAGPEGLFLMQSDTIDWIIRGQVVTDVSVNGETVAASLYYQGIIRFKSGDPRARELITTDNGLPKSSFRAVMIDQQGSTWVGTDGDGLVQIFPYDLRVYTATSGLSNVMVNQISRYNHEIIVATDAGVFHSNDEGSFQFLEPTQKVRTWCAEAIPGNQLLVGYDTSTVLYQPDRDGRLKQVRQLWDFATNDVLVQGDSIWIGTEKGLRLIHPDGRLEVFNQEAGFSSMYCYALARDGNGLYVATDRGLNFLQDHQVTVWETDRVIWDVAIDTQGKIWLGTDSGLLAMNSKGEKLAWYSQQEGLPGSNVYSVMAAPEGVIWLGTNQGIARIEGGNISVLGYEDGLPANEMNNKAIMAENSGIWFGSVKGLIHLPSQIRLSSSQVPVIPYQYWVDGKQVAAWPTTLAYSHPVLSLELGAPDFLNSGVNFRYRFFNRSEEWIGLDANTQLNLSSLSPGRYDIGVQARGVHHIDWGPIYHLPGFTIQPPFYQRWEFLASVLVFSILLFSGLTYVVVRYKNTRETVKRQEEEIALAREFNQQIASTGLPKISKEWQISIDFRPRNEFSGDFYFAFRGRDERFCVIVGDVSGSGLETSYMNGFIKMSLQSKDWSEWTMTAWLIEMNQALHRLPKMGFNLAITAVVINELTGQAFYSSAGNPPPFMVTGAGRLEKLNASSMPPLGVFRDWRPVWQELTIMPGSLIGIHSDGLEQNQKDAQTIEPMEPAEILGLSARETLNTLVRTRWLVEHPDDRLLVIVNRMFGAVEG